MTIRILFIAGIFTCYCLILTEQRLEHRKNSLKIIQLSQKIDTINSHKQELINAINRERIRLIRQTSNMGKKLNLKEIVEIT